MSNLAIKVDHLSKEYHIAGAQMKYTTLRDMIVRNIMAPVRRTRSLLRGHASGAAELNESFWALDDISFEVRQGEVVGIIGRNGAGKSTLLKILSRITEPTKGYADIYGRVGSLLEVGTGFHPELTGRENVYLNGAILGMPRAEIDRKFDEIVAFSEIEKFIDTPVKHYSSGMSVRLAFAVAAHLEPEILIIDEVLAVGDLAFQQKSLGKMDDVAKSGRTVLFVSHTMSTVQALCTRAILLQNGQVTHDGPTDEVVQEYLGAMRSKSGQNLIEDNESRSGSGEVRFTRARVLNEAGDVAQALVAGKPAYIELDYENQADAKRAYFAMTIYNHLGIAVTNLNTELTDFQAELGPKGTVRCYLPNLPLPLGQYRIAAAINVNGKVADLLPSLVSFDVSSSTFYDSSRVANIKYCAVMVEHRWEHEDIRERV